MLNAPAAAATSQLGYAPTVAFAGVAVSAERPTTAATAKIEVLFLILIPSSFLSISESQARKTKGENKSTCPHGQLDWLLIGSCQASYINTVD
jgi:hypothetical protein